MPMLFTFKPITRLEGLEAMEAFCFAIKVTG